MKFDQISVLLYSYIKKLNIPFSKITVQNELDRHPAPNSLLAISEILSSLRLDNAAYFMELHDISNEYCPLITQISRNNGEFVLVEQILEKSVRLTSNGTDAFDIDLDEFSKIYCGAILVAEASDEVTDIDYKRNRRKEIVEALRLPFLITSSGLIVFALIFQNLSYITSIGAAILTWDLVKGLGISVTILLLIQAFDANNALVKKFCNNTENNGCNNILSSKAAKLTEELSLSEIGFFYFLSTFLILLFHGKSIAVIQILSLLSVLSIPFTLYSVYYQYSVAKQWCSFCLTVVALLWIEFALSIRFLGEPIRLINLRELISVITLFIVPVALWVYLKPAIGLSKSNSLLKQNVDKFKKDTKIFNAALLSQPPIPEQDWSIRLNNNSEIQKIITIVSNPTCMPCAKAHILLDQWLDTVEGLQLRIVFWGFPNDPKDYTYKVARHLMLLSNQQSPLLRQAINAWYRSGMSLDDLEKTFPVTEIADVDELMLIQHQWCGIINVSRTPTIFINGYHLPEPYELVDIKYMI